MGISRDLSARQLAGQPDYSGADYSGAGSVEQIRVRILPDGRMTQADAARYIGLTQKTLANLASQGKGPRRIKVQGRIFYYRADLDRFIRGEAD
jgi:hypothetical protein